MRDILGDPLLALFTSMTLRDQRHCFDVYRAVRGTGCGDDHLLTAALLHDAGKGRMAGDPVRLWHRVTYVLLAASAPWLLRALTTGDRGGLASLRHHAERGARLAESLGAAPSVADAIRRHEKRDATDEGLRLLRTADDAC